MYSCNMNKNLADRPTYGKGTSEKFSVVYIRQPGVSSVDVESKAVQKNLYLKTSVYT